MKKLVKYAKYEPILKEVYRLSLEKGNDVGVNICSSSEIHLPYSNIVQDYLMTLDMDSIKVVQTVMYLGRDFNIEEENNINDADLLIDEWMNELTKGKGWKTESIEAHQIAGKGPLNDYLKRAFKILGIQ